MRKLSFIPAIALLCFFISCNDHKGGLSPAAQKNLEAHHAIAKMFETKDFSKIGDYIAADAVDHAGEHGDVKGLDSIKAQFEKWSASADDAKAESIKDLADDEYVMGWMRFTGTAKDAQMGVKPGDRYDMQAIEVSKYKDGKVVEHWTFVDPKEMMEMMMNMAPQQQHMPADSTKK